ncbi:TonB-dependent receptor [Alteromonas sp. a30]|uniref:TonB-dependent receptor n=1 Tax=Alteromonas sp. a30 TaxID=2730917 RepID=UPI002280022D|nr:TonB-dependent receptor [Alteromonas sp. a30]MCY7296633.1 TonB-dependent receptor [Alteromonas sp. a30]
MLNRRFSVSKVALALTATLCATSAYPALSQENKKQDSGLEVIMVTAQKRVQNVKEVPISMSAIDKNKLLENNIADSEELSAYIANFSISETSQGFNVFMRGLGSGPNQGFEQTVGTYVDGVYRGRAHLMRSAFLDLERVEVLRGPQSALFGKNTTAGALNLTNAKPTQDFEGYVNATYNFDFNTRTIEAAVSNGLTDTLSGRLAVKVEDTDGFMDNTLSGQEEVANDTAIARLTLAWEPLSNTKITLTAQHDENESDGFTNSQAFVEPAIIASGAPILAQLQDVIIDDNTHKANPLLGEIEQTDFEADHLTLNMEVDFDNYVFTSITGWQDYSLEQSDDGDHGALPLVFRVRGDEEFDQLSQEFRITSNFDGKFNYIAGVYYQDSSLTYEEDYLVYPLNVLGDRHFNVESETWAAFAQLDYAFTEQWQATLGLRYSSEDKDGVRSLFAVDPTTRTRIVDLPLVQAPVIAEAFPQGLPGAVYSQVVLAPQNFLDHDINGSRSEDEFTPSLNIKYKMDDAMIYASVSTGTKAGGFDARANHPNDFEFEDEEVTAYEIGAKLTLLDGDADLNIAAFSMDFEDLQTSVFDGNTGFFVENGSEASSIGVEVDGRWIIDNNWLVSGSVGWLDFEWDEFTGAKCFASVTLVPDNVEANGVSCNLEGKTNAFAPEFSGSLNLEYYTEIFGNYELKANLDVIYKSDYYTNSDLNPFTQQEAFTKLNARVALNDSASSWQVALLAKNLTDKTVINYSTDMPLIGPGFYSVWVEPGRSFSLQFQYNF